MPSRKAARDQVVYMPRRDEFGVVVDYRSTPSPRYLIVRTDEIGRNPHLRPIWIESTEFQLTKAKSITPARVYRSNKRLEKELEDGRWCECSCCEHP